MTTGAVGEPAAPVAAGLAATLLKVSLEAIAKMFVRRATPLLTG